MTEKIIVRYATWSEYKKEEIQQVSSHVNITDVEGRCFAVGELFEFEFSDVQTREPLECDLEEMVRHKVKSAYRHLMAPCIVEHAGIIYDDYLDQSYPGGLTQPMWDAMGAESFVEETKGAGRRATATAVIGYCDGMKVHTFKGETRGKIADGPRGSRKFYWDTVFCPDGGNDQTYAEICDDPNQGLVKKVELSQSVKAMTTFLGHLINEGPSPIFPDF